MTESRKKRRRSPGTATKVAVAGVSTAATLAMVAGMASADSAADIIATNAPQVVAVTATPTPTPAAPAPAHRK